MVFLFKVCVFLLSLFEQWKIGVGVFPEREEGFIFVKRVVGFVLQRVSACEAEVGEIVEIDNGIDSWIGENHFVLVFSCTAVFCC